MIGSPKERYSFSPMGFTTSYDVLLAGFISNLSPMMHHCDNIKTIIDNAVTDKGLNLEICLVPRNILYGQKDEKLTTNAVEVLVEHTSINTI